jgi:hypothetical protein
VEDESDGAATMTPFYLDPATAYYLPGTTGWDIFAATSGLPTVAWNPPPQIGKGSANAQAIGSAFDFTIMGYLNQVVTIEASTNLVDWQPIQTITLSGTSTNLTDAQWKNYPSRFYRVQ